MKQMRRIGVLGGMGPEATILLQQRLVAAVDAQDDRDHIPLLIDMNPQVPSRIERLIHGRGDDPAPVLADMARLLEAAGAEALAMPCNTAHHYAGAIAGAVEIPFLNMPERAAARAATRIGPGGAVGVLASPATELTGLFPKVLQAHGLQALFPQDPPRMLSAIQRIKAAGPGDADRATLKSAARELAARGARCILVGCSEFSLISEAAEGAVPVIDTLDVLVDEIVAFAGAKKETRQTGSIYQP